MDTARNAKEAKKKMRVNGQFPSDHLAILQKD
jgi:hypothetical protein